MLGVRVVSVLVSHSQEEVRPIHLREKNSLSSMEVELDLRPELQVQAREKEFQERETERPD